jgi:hypothetical protein
MNALAELKSLTAPFSGTSQLFEMVEHVPSSTVPEPYKSLLVHEHHMTVTMEQHHNCTVDVEVLAELLEGESYAREIILRNHATRQVVQYGLIRFDFQYVTKSVKDQILAKQTPLGRVLILHNVLRHIDLGAILELKTGPRLTDIFECPPGSKTYGRLATIFCNNKPAVDLLEISVPL